MSYCDTCIHHDVCGVEGVDDEAMTYCADRIEPCEDAISRQQAIDKMQELENEDIEAYGCAIPEGFDGQRAIERLKALPSIQPQPKTGHWIDREIYDADRWKCSECGRTEQYRENYCPSCGARMVET